MTASAYAPFGSRLDRLRADLRAARLDAFLVSHLANITYLTSFHGSAGALVLSPEACHLVVDFRYAVTARAAASRSPGAFGVTVAESSVDDTAAALLAGAVRIGVEASSLSVSRFHALAARLAAPPRRSGSDEAGVPELLATERMVERARAVKDAAEIGTLREAGRRLAGVALDVPALLRGGRREIEVAADIDALLRGAGFERPAFETIVASGPNGALPHARPGGRRLEQGDGVVLDFGGVYDGYCVDLTRSAALGTPTPAWQRMLDVVREAQQAAIAVVRPGIPGAHVDAAARDVLWAHGLGAAFGHATGHGIGLEVHEDPRIGRHVPGRTEDLLQPGMVFTVEPGAYVEGVGGVRLEDDVLVTAAGCEVLTVLSGEPRRDTHGG